MEGRSNRFRRAGMRRLSWSELGKLARKRSAPLRDGSPDEYWVSWRSPAVWPVCAVPGKAPELQPRRLVSGQFAIIRDSGHSCKARRAGHNKSVFRAPDRRMISLGCGLYLFTLNPVGEPERMPVG